MLRTMESSANTSMIHTKDGIFDHITMDSNTIMAVKLQQNIGNAIGALNPIQIIL